VPVSKATVYRIQDEVGRGPFRPGFSYRWADDTFTAGSKAFPTWMEEFGEHLIQKRGRSGEHFGSAVRTIEKLCEWFSPTERLKLASMGFNAVSMTIDRVLAESENQLVFARKLPLHWAVVVVPWAVVPRTYDPVGTPSERGK
jgi:hypothetical protein